MDVSTYIQKHLQHLQFDLNLLKIVHDSHNFFVINIDTLFISFMLGILFITFFYFILKRNNSDMPSKLENFVEIILEFIMNTIKDNFKIKSIFLASLSVTIFVWILLMNIMDFLPLDIIPSISNIFIKKDIFRSVATSDPNTTFAISISVFFIIIYYNLKIKGLYGFLKHIIKEPFGIYLFPINIIFKVIEEIVKPLSLSLRLFGNIFSGELIFILISALIPWWQQWVFGNLWGIFHIFISIIQAFIFMMLTIIYITIAHEK